MSTARGIASMELAGHLDSEKWNTTGDERLIIIVDKIVTWSTQGCSCGGAPRRWLGWRRASLRGDELDERHDANDGPQAVVWMFERRDRLLASER